MAHIGNTPAVRRKLTMCKERVEYYRSIGALERVDYIPDILQSLHVVSRPGRKDRLVLDLSRNLNGFVSTPKF